MSTNYFNVPTFTAPRTVTPAPVNFQIPEMPTLPSGLDASIMGNAAAPNYAARNMLAGQLGSGGSIATRFAGLMRARRDALKSQTRGYGGISYRDDDPNTLEDESLTPVIEQGRMGQNERDAYNSALSRSAATGTTYSSAGEQLVGAALQRVSDEAAKIISQYAGDINGLATDQLNASSTALNNYLTMYGSDAQWALTQKVPDVTTTNPTTTPPDQIVSSGGAVSPTNEFVNGKTVYSSAARPNIQSYRNRFPSSKGYVVQEIPPAKKGGKWTVKVTFLFNPASPSSPGVDAGTAGLLPGTPAGDTTRGSRTPPKKKGKK